MACLQSSSTSPAHFGTPVASTSWLPLQLAMFTCFMWAQPRCVACCGDRCSCCQLLHEANAGASSYHSLDGTYSEVRQALLNCIWSCARAPQRAYVDTALCYHSLLTADLLGISCAEVRAVWVQVVAKWKAHTKNARAMHYDMQQNVLLTGSFDRTVKVYGHHTGQLRQLDA